MPRKRKYYYVNDDTGTTRRSGLSDFAGSAGEMLIAVFALAVMAVLCLIAMIVLIAVQYWYITVPALIGIAYLYYKHKTAKPAPDPAHTVTTTTETIKTPTGTKQIVTTETRDTTTKPAHPAWSLLSGLFH